MLAQAPPSEKKMVQLEQENCELKKVISEFKQIQRFTPVLMRLNLFRNTDTEKKFVFLEQELSEMKKSLQMKSEEISDMHREKHRQQDQKYKPHLFVFVN